ncbi:MAG: hypothetical protein IBX64_02945 [Actinobacteria bacterium]|nr:hypothetical protein [Actinomycetota bacterium]
MSELKLTYTQVKNFPYIRFEGELTINNFTALHLVVKGATKFATIPVIVNLSGDLLISDEIKKVRCWQYPPTIPDYANRVVLLIISTAERLEEIKTLLTPHKLQHASSLQEAIDILGKTSGEST